MSVFGVILVRIQSECGKMRTRITPKTDIFYAVFVIVAPRSEDRCKVLINISSPEKSKFNFTWISTNLVFQVKSNKKETAVRQTLDLSSVLSIIPQSSDSNSNFNIN